MDPNHVFYSIIAAVALYLIFKVRELAEVTRAVAGATGNWALGGGTIVLLFMGLEFSHDALMIALLPPTARTMAECQTLQGKLLTDMSTFGLVDDSRIAADQNAYNACTQRLARSAAIMSAVIEK